MTQPFLPRVSVIVPIYNGETDLPDLIDCLRSQTYPAESVEYLLVDNNSSDRTATLLQSATQSAAADGLTIRPIAENQIQSSYAARNAGIRAST
ncbi:MAG: glycosyltransferase family A protein, partial [Cyanobacteriota bacterium]